LDEDIIRKRIQNRLRRILEEIRERTEYLEHKDGIREEGRDQYIPRREDLSSIDESIKEGQSEMEKEEITYEDQNLSGSRTPLKD
jgi:hypothetical protein